MQLITDFFLKCFPENIDKIKKIKKIKHGFSNSIYKLSLLNNVSYKVRIADNNHLISRKNEIEIIKFVNDEFLVFFDEDTGNAIYHWIEGCNLKKNNINKDIFLQVIELSKKFHVIDNLSLKILPHDHFDHHDISKQNIDDIYTQKYKELINQHKNLKLCLCHNDISLKNLIYCSKTNSLHLIDYEWGRMNTIYWDFGNFLKNIETTKKDIELFAQLSNLDKKILLDFVFIATYYSLQLSYVLPRQDTLKKYQYNLKLYLTKYFKWINKN